MQWLEALNIHLKRMKGTLKRGQIVTCAIVEQTQVPREVSVTDYPGWSIEERRTPRGNIALHLFPS